jgi:uncharacterized protein (DUF58 family)
LLSLGHRIVGWVAVVARSITPVGRWVLVVGVASWLVGRWLGWQEFLLVAGGCLLSVVVALVFTIGRTDAAARVEVVPPRVVVGQEAVGRVVVDNSGRHRRLPAHVELPVGRTSVQLAVPSLGPGERWEEIVVIPTTRRAVMTIGPARAVRGDPLGLARRAAPLTEPVELFVHPRTVRMAGLTSGWLRDLEGRPTNDLSPSDIAFHTLREYVPGDDRRHIHWRTSARLGTLMVRQFVDTRRSQLGLVLSTNPGHYAEPAEFEAAISVIGSLGVSTLLDDQDVAVSTGSRPIPSHTATALLDSLAGLETAARGAEVDDIVRGALPTVSDASIVAMAFGSKVDTGTLRAAADRFPRDGRVLAVRVVPGAAAEVQTMGSTSVLTLGVLADLPRLVRGVLGR